MSPASLPPLPRATLAPLVIRAIREVCRLSQQDAAGVFGGGPKALKKYETGEGRARFSHDAAAAC
jgi:DNA-binding transcriptional regulator YiaG